MTRAAPVSRDDWSATFAGRLVKRRPWSATSRGTSISEVPCRKAATTAFPTDSGSMVLTPSAVLNSPVMSVRITPGTTTVVRDSGPAAAELAAACDVAARLGARPLLAAVDVTARRTRLGRSDVVAPGPLTAREREVLALLAEGRTTRQIGQQPYIAEKTASVHVSNLMAKLGVSGRTDAVSRAYRAGLLASN